MWRLVYKWSIVKFYILVFCVILPTFCHRMYFSIYYNQYLHMKGSDPNTYSRRVNDERRRQAETFLTSNVVSSYPTLETQPSVRLAVGFVTVNRQPRMEDGSVYNPGYLLQTVAAILREKPPFPTRLLVCNVDSDPLSNSDAVFLSPIVPVLSRYQHADVPIRGKTLSSRLQKEKDDYVYCLNQTLALNAEYILIIEDDALATQGTLDIIEHIIITKLEKKYHGFDLKDNNSTKSIIKLFSPQYIQRDFFTTKPKRIIINILELVGIGIVGATTISLVHFILVKKCRNPYVFHNMFFVVNVICCILAALAISRPHRLELRRISKHLYVMIDANDCCTPAVLYPKSAAMELMSYMQTDMKHGRMPLDGVMDEFVRERGYRQFAVEPNLFSHIGQHSTLHSDSKLKFLQNFI
uniref:Uncharacterized protein n=1 Tax=Branchiostoma floridae TaxID=7739 RepID=C3Z5L5_BRAFL|eukprot:XP_002596116.1 hypothetical protein BRAFLDRAFT_202811 [Branchiostoma floridae]